MLDKIKKNKKQVENQKNFNILKKSPFFILCNKKSESFQNSLIFEQELKKEKNIKFKNFKKGSLNLLLQNTFLKEIPKFFEGQLFIVWGKNMEHLDISKIVTIIEKTSSLSIIICKIGDNCYTNNNIRKLSESTLQDLQIKLFYDLLNLSKKPFFDTQHIKNRLYFLLKTQKGL